MRRCRVHARDSGDAECMREIKTDIVGGISKSGLTRSSGSTRCSTALTDEEVCPTLMSFRGHAQRGRGKRPMPPMTKTVRTAALHRPRALAIGQRYQTKRRPRRRKESMQMRPALH
eukprot:175426-Pleurochrysis_carterae.AAC.2